MFIEGSVNVYWRITKDNRKKPDISPISGNTILFVSCFLKKRDFL